MDIRVVEHATAWHQSPMFIAAIGLVGAVLGAVIAGYFSVKAIRENQRQQMRQEKLTMLIRAAGHFSRGASGYVALRNTSNFEAFGDFRSETRSAIEEAWPEVDEGYGTLSLLLTGEPARQLDEMYVNCRALKEIVRAETEEVGEAQTLESRLKKLPRLWGALQVSLHQEVALLTETAPRKK